MNYAEKEPLPRSVEQQANYQGSWSELALSRLEDPKIRTQFFSMLLEADQYASRENLELELDQMIEKLKTSTPITFENRPPFTGLGPDHRELLSLGYVSSVSGEGPTAKIWNILEAHEKGHSARWGYGSRDYDEEERRNDGSLAYFLGEKFGRGFDFDEISYPEKDLEEFRKKNPQYAEKGDKEIINILNRYITNPMEIAERMSQLKNYFGFSGNEKFTKEHLAYAREHYIEDTGYDNSMSKFFTAITSQKEDAFIVSVGVG